MESGSQNNNNSIKFLGNQEFSILVDMFNKLQESQNRSLDELAAARKEQNRLTEIIRKKDEELIRLHEQLAIFQKMLFGRKSEKLPLANQNPEVFQMYLPFDNGLESLDNPVTFEPEQKSEELLPVETEEVKGYSRSKRGRKALSDALPRQEIIIGLPESELKCACGHKMEVIKEIIREELEHFPSFQYVKRYIRFSYACRHCEGTESEGIAPAVISAPPMPQLLPKSIATPSLLAYILTSKFCDSLPFYRISGMMGRNGVEISRATMCRWAIEIAEKLRPMIEAFKDYIKTAPVLHMDETTLQVNKEPGRSASTKSYMWIAKSGGGVEHPTVLFTYNQSRAAKVAAEILSDYKGFLMTDGYKVYDSALKNNSGVVHLACLAHIRRHYMDAMTTLTDEQIKESFAKRAVEDYIGKVYAVEKEISDAAKNGKPYSYDEIKQIRHEKALPVLKNFRKALLIWRNKITPTSRTGKAIAYTLEQWDKLMRYLDDGRLPVDNNSAEQLAKAYVVGRKAWLFSDTVEGAEASAVFFSLINTIKANGLEPYWYLRYLLEKMTFMKSLDKESLTPLMPQNTDASVIEEFRRNNSIQNIDFTTPVRIIYENGIFKPANQ